LAGYEDLNDATRLASDPTFQLMGSKKIGDWSLTSLRHRLIKTGGRLVKHAHYYWLLLVEGHHARERFGSMLRRIAALPQPDGYYSTVGYLYSRSKRRTLALTLLGSPPSGHVWKAAQ
jgi:hypothetical protein